MAKTLAALHLQPINVGRVWCGESIYLPPRLYGQVTQLRSIVVLFNPRAERRVGWSTGITVIKKSINYHDRR
jgi:hypothetical protein